jgi:hypothetical protein
VDWVTSPRKTISHSTNSPKAATNTDKRQDFS